MQEEWKTIPGFGYQYLVSSTGKVWNVSKGEFVALIPHRQGYLRAHLRKGGVRKQYYVHRLVLLAFSGFSALQVNHLDGNKSNNNLKNLAYVTPSQNIQHAYDSDLMPSRAGEHCGQSKLTWEIVDQIRTKEYSAIYWANRYNLHISTIYYIYQNKTWKNENRPNGPQGD